MAQDATYGFKLSWTLRLMLQAKIQPFGMFPHHDIYIYLERITHKDVLIFNQTFFLNFQGEARQLKPMDEVIIKAKPCMHFVFVCRFT